MGIAVIRCVFVVLKMVKVQQMESKDHSRPKTISADIKMGLSLTLRPKPEGGIRGE